MSWPVLMLLMILLLAAVCSLGGLFYHWLLIGFEIDKAQQIIAETHELAKQVKEDIEDLKKGLP